MINKNIKNRKFVKEIINLITIMIAVTVAQIVADYFFRGAFVWNIIILLVVLLILSPLKICINSKIEKYYENKRNDQ